MKISHSPYLLYPRNSLNAVSVGEAREGTLLKVEWEGGLVGYADLHPWPELGDLPLVRQISDLRSGYSSDLVKQSLWMARRDALLRHKVQHIFSGGEPVKNNWIVTNIQNFDIGSLQKIKDLGFTTLKVKAGRSVAAEIAALEKIAEAGLGIRLDFNASGSWDKFRNYLMQIPAKVLSRIEYVEDPFPFDPSLWNEARRLVPIALDNQYSQVPWASLQEAPCDVLVLKPAKTDVSEALAYCEKWHLKMTVTSYMDHPVGVLHALGVAMELKKKHPNLILDAGCLTHHLYEEDVFSSAITVQGAYILQTPGAGVGFDHLLETLPWQPLSQQ